MPGEYHESSGQMAMEANESALMRARNDLNELRIRAERGEIVDDEVRRVAALIHSLKADQDKIRAAGM